MTIDRFTAHLTTDDGYGFDLDISDDGLKLTGTEDTVLFDPRRLAIAGEILQAAWDRLQQPDSPKAKAAR